MNVLADPQSIRQALPRQARAKRRFWSFTLLVALPTLLVFLYLQFVASPQYATEFRYSVYNQPQITAASATAAAPSDTSDQQPNVHADYVVGDYLQSRQVVDELRRKLNLGSLFHGRGFDPVFHFWWDDASLERLSLYWTNWVLEADFEPSSMLGYVSVRAFTAADSLRLAQALAELSEEVVNDIGARSRQDAVRFAEAALARADARMQAAGDALKNFRERLHTYTPEKPADATEALAATLRQNLATMSAQRATLAQSLSANAPAMLSLKAQIAATEKQLDRVASTFGAENASEAGRTRLLPQELNQYDSLQQERSFAADAREAAFRRLEQARFDASVQHLYLQVHSKPLLAQHALYPKPVRWSALAFVTMTVIWMIGTLLYYTIREHAG